MPANPLSAEQRADAARLKSKFNAWKEDRRDQGERVSQERASEMLGFGQSALSQYLNGKIPLNVDAASKIAKLIGCTVSDFSESLAQQVANYTVGNGGAENHKNKPDEFVIPQFKTGGAMGNGVLLRDQPGVIQSWHVNSEWINKNIKHHTAASNLCIVTGFGDSMRPMFNPGDPLLVDSGVKSVEFDSVYFFRVGEEGFIKRLQRIPGEGLRVLSTNKDYDTWTIKPDMDFEVFGRVLKVWRSDEF